MIKPYQKLSINIYKGANYLNYISLINRNILRTTIDCYWIPLDEIFITKIQVKSFIKIYLKND
jgi:hypothetical protein